MAYNREQKAAIAEVLKEIINSLEQESQVLKQGRDPLDLHKAMGFDQSRIYVWRKLIAVMDNAYDVGKSE